MVVFPNAKINVGLHITGKRNDGYHNLESYFYPIALSDILEVVENKKLSFNTTGISIPGAWEDNLCIKAYKILEQDFKIPPVNMHLHKLIPIGAGLGGGSSDGAFALKALNELFELHLDVPQLEVFALRLGSDCPFFIKNEPSFVSGRGEVFEKAKNSLKGKYIVLVNPLVHVSTAEAYGDIKVFSKGGTLKEVIEKTLVENWREKVKNDFEDSLFQKYPDIALIKNMLYEKGALYASMTGSGSSVFGIFDKEVEFAGLFSPNYPVWQGELV